MAQTYTRQSSFADGDTITSALFNNEYNQLVNAFTYSSSSASSTGHRHDGTAGQGGNIHTIGDLDFLNKIVVDDSNNRWGVFVEVSSAAVEQIRIQDGAIVPVTDSDIDLGTTGVRFKDAYIDSITTTGNVAVGGNLTVTGTTTFNGGTITMGDAATDNVVFGADVDSNIIPDDDDSYDLGSSSQEWRNLFIDGTANIDSLVADTADINGGTVDGAVIGGSTAAAITGTTITGTAITGTSFVIGSADISEAELETIDGVTAGTVAASKAIVVDSNKDFTGARNITLTGELDAGSLDVSGDVDVDGTLETDALSINGTAVTSTAAELNILDGVTSTAAELNILDGVTSTATELNLLDGVTSTTAELNILDGVTASAADINLIDGITNGTVIASKAIITDSNKDITGGRNITISGELDAATLDISGDADIDGTLEADAITIGGVTLAETISDTVGAMVSSNTETNITVTYEDSDNTLDFVIGTLNQDTTGNAATATALETARTIGGTSFDGSANIAVALSATATALATARTIHGVSFDGTANIDLSEVVQDTVGAMFSSNTESGITVAYEDGDGTIDLTVGTLNQNTTGSAATLTTARTIGGVSFDGSANITPTTFTTATFSGDVNVDSGLLFADVSANRVGINQASPDVSLDLGANTDAVHVPVGTTAQRPGSPAAGYFRYNSTNGKFEGYTDEWGSIGGGSGTNMDTNIFAGDGSDTTFTLSNAPDDENNLMVFVDGVFQAQNVYSVSGTTLTFATAPANGRVITVYHSTTTVGGSNNTINTMTGDNSDTTLTLSVAPVHENNTQVYFDGVYQSKANYAISGTTLTFSTAPATGVLVEAITNTNTSSTTANQLLDADGDTKIQVEESSDEDKIRFDTGGSERMVLDSSGLNITTADNSDNLTLTSTDADASVGPNLNLYRNSGSPADSDVLGVVTFNGRNDNSQDVIYARQLSYITDASDGTEDGTFKLQTMVAGTIRDRLNITPTEISINEDSKDLDFRVESDNLTHALFVNGADGKIGINQSDPTGYYADNLVVGAPSEGGISIAAEANTHMNYLMFAEGTSGAAAYRGYLAYKHDSTTTSGYMLASSAGAIRINAGGAERMRIDSSGNVGIGTSSPTSGRILDANGQVRFQSSSSGRYFDFVNDSSASYLDVSHALNIRTNGASSLTTAIAIDTSGNVGIGTTSPSGKLDVHLGATGIIAEFRGADSDILQINSESDLIALDIRNTTNGLDFQVQGTSKMRMDASGNVGIGTSSPSQKLHVVGKIKLTDDLIIGGTSPRIDYDGGSSGALRFFSTSANTERMRLDSSGRLLIGTTSSTDGLSNTPTKMLVSASDASSGVATPLASFQDMDTSVESGSTILAIGFNADTSFSTSNYIRFTDSGGENGSISGTGDGTIDFNTSSDKRRKENIEDSPNTLETLNQVEVKKYNFIGSEKKQIGMLAQDLYEIIPDVVKVGGEDENENPWSINYGRLTPFLIKAIQEQQTIIEDLKTRIETLEG